MTKVQDNLPPIPKDWVWTRLERVSEEIQYGYTAKSVKEPIGPRLLRITDIQRGSVDWQAVPYCQISEDKIVKFLLNEGDILFARTGATVGKSYLVPKGIPNSVFASYLIRLVLVDIISKKYIYYYFQSPHYWMQISIEKAGIGQPNVNATKLSNLILPLPPLPEQHRIVARIEELYTRLDAGVESVRKVKAQLPRYRQAVLKHAFEGKLTEEWRRTHKHEIEPALVVIERVLKKRQRMWEKAVSMKRKPLTKRGRRRESYAEPLTFHQPEIKLPDGWVWTNLDTLTYFIVDYRGKTPPTAEKGIQIISAADIKGGKIIINKQRFVSPEVYEKWTTRGLPKPGDLIITTEAPVGEVALYPEGETYLLTRRVLACQTLGVINSYLVYCFYSEFIRKYLVQQSRGTTVPRILKPMLMSTPIPLPPLLEQQQIVNEVELHLSVIHKTGSSVEQSIKHSERLRRSILKLAFEGRLVPQDPADETEEKLLE